MFKRNALFENYNLQRKNSTYKKCIYKNNECSEKIVKAHSIQNNRILNKLSENGRVLYFDFGRPQKPFKFQNVGRKKATTFSGFCSFHDTSLFAPIENEDYVVGNREQEFLFAYRAFARGYATKKTAVSLSSKIKEMSFNNEYFTSSKAKLIEYGLERTLDNFERCKLILNKNLSKRDFFKIKTDVIVFEQEYSFAVSSVFYLLGDLYGRLINDPLDPNKYITPFFLTIFPDNGCTYILMSYLSKDKSRYSFLREQIVGNSIENQKRIISNLVVVNSENIAFSPLGFKKLTEKERNRFYEIYNKTAFLQPAVLAPYPDLNIFI